MCMGILPTSLSVHYVHSVSVKASRGSWILWNWSYRMLGSAMWVLRTEPESSGRAASILLNH